MSQEAHSTPYSDEGASEDPLQHPNQHILGEDVSLEALGRFIVQNDVRDILVLIGAGASVAAGIPDFRSPKTGIYNNLSQYNLKCPTDAFSIALLRERPDIFYTIAREMDLWPGKYKPTAVHYFIRLLELEGRLLRLCTQNIDGLEGEAGVSPDLVVEAHGNFRRASCIDCHAPYDIQQNKQEALQGRVSRCRRCQGIVKPDVVFFGEKLPERFYDVVVSRDVQRARLVFIIGTSLQVQPFAQLPFMVGKEVLRVLINAERVGGYMFHFPSDDVERRESEDEQPDSDSAEEEEDDVSSSSSDGWQSALRHYCQVPEVKRDLFYKGDCQEIVKVLAASMGVSQKLEALMASRA